jgi:predicted transcriptional regulator
MQTQIDDVRLHIEQLATEIHTRQVELEEGERLRLSLREEIEQKLSEVEAWQSLSEQQKKLFVNAAKEAIDRRTSLQMIAVVLSSIALNLAASVLWSLMGSPGAQQLRSMFESFKNIFT